MSAQERKIWIFLTVLALLILSSRWLVKRQYNQCHTRVNTHISHVYESSEVQTLPQPLNLLTVRKHINPYRCRQSSSRLRGKVVASVLVNEDGKGLKYRVIASTNHRLKHRVQKYISDLKFIPARYKGKAVKCWVNVKFQY